MFFLFIQIYKLNTGTLFNTIVRKNKCENRSIGNCQIPINNVTSKQFLSIDFIVKINIPFLADYKTYDHTCAHLCSC